MALNVKVGTFTKRSGTGTQSITGLGFQPKALLIWWVGSNGSPQFANDLRKGFGFSDGTTSKAVSAFGNHNAAGAAAQTSRGAAFIISDCDGSQTTIRQAALTSFDADGFTLNWTTNDGSTHHYQYIAWGGSDISAKVLSWVTNTVTGNQSISGAGFQPDLVFHLGIGQSNSTDSTRNDTDGRVNFGMMEKNGGQGGLGLGAQSVANPTVGYRSVRTDSCIEIPSSSSADTARATYVSMDADGFTVNFATAPGSGRRVYSLCIKGLRTKIGNFIKSVTAAPTTQAITGVGFAPACVLCASDLNNATGNASNGMMSIGAASGVAARAATVGRWKDAVATSSGQGYQNESALLADIDEATASQVNSLADLQSLDSGGFTLSFSTNSSEASIWSYLAMGQTNQAPNAPNLTTKANFDATQSTQFTWAFSDSDPFDTQSAYQLQIYRVSTGLLVYDSGQVSASTAAHTLPANTLSNPIDYQWKVRTWDSSSLVGPYSSLSNFSTSAAPTVAITTPVADGTVVGTASLTAVWTFTDPEGGAQQSYEVVLKDAGTLAVISDSGRIYDASARSYTLNDLATGSSLRLEITAWDAAGVPTTTVRLFTVNFTPPNTPTLAIVNDAANGRNVITITNPAGGAPPAASSNALYRKRSSDSTWTRIATGLAVNAVYSDYTPRSGYAYDYKVRTTSTTGSTADSATSTTTLNLTKTFLHEASNPSGTIRGYRDTTVGGRSSDWVPELTQNEYVGRTNPVSEYGPHEQYTVQAQILVIDGTGDYDALQSVHQRKVIVCYRDPSGKKVFGTLPSFSESDNMGYASVALRVDQVDYSEAV